MNPPLLLIGAGLLFWGWQAELLALAVPMAIILEASRYVPWRWEFSDRDLNRLADLTNLLFAGVAVYLFYQHGPHGVYATVRWVPALLFVLFGAQIYSTRGTLSLSSLLLGVRRHEARGGEPGASRVDLTYPYFATCVIAAGVAAYDNPWFFPGALLLTAWGLSQARPRRYSAITWTGLILLAGTLGYAGQWGVRNLQLTVEELVLAWFKDQLWGDTDPYRSRTAIGHIGRLKFSDRVVLHVQRTEPDAGPLLLRQASYQDYRASAWDAREAPFERVARGSDLGTWTLGDDGAGVNARITISGPLSGGRGILPLPGGAHRIEGLPVPGLKSNPFGAVRLDDGPRFVSYTVPFGPASARDQAPADADLRVPKHQRAVIERVSQELGLPGRPPEGVLSRLEGFFGEGFRYSLVQDAEIDDLPPLAHFLLNSRKGHCEYFATATVLLLRSAGIPSRYATGYAVQEPGPHEDLFLVRQRHAHAWALAHIDGVWRDVDLTPGIWAALEQSQAPWWLPAYDLFSRAAFGLSRWRWSTERQEATDMYAALLAPLVLVLGWRLYRQRRSTRAGLTGPEGALRVRSSGTDSDFYRLVHHLEQTGPPREPGETLQCWLTRLGYAGNRGELQEALGLHYRYRFDPAGLTQSEKARMTRLVSDWLATRPSVTQLRRRENRA